MCRSSLCLPALLCLAAWVSVAGCREAGTRSTSGPDSTPGTSAEPLQGDAALIANALSAGTPQIAEGATVVVRGGGTMRTLREGTNGWTCFPDNPANPGNMPMCVDQATRDWLAAFSTRKPPPQNSPIGISYLLQGSWFPNAVDPEAAAGPDVKGVFTGPMLMLVNVPSAILAGYPRSAEKPGAPFVMYAGTPYEHLMIPISSAR